jgi:predicted nucleotide-binding protein
MEKSVGYSRTLFSANVVREALGVFTDLLGEFEPGTHSRTVERGPEKWDFDTDEEFFAEYRREPRPRRVYYACYAYPERGTYSFRLSRVGYDTSIVVVAPTRPEIESVFEIFDRNRAAAEIPLPPAPPPTPPPPPTVFIGHGRSQQWRDLKDHLHEQHGYPVDAYEIGARAGHAIRDILEDMLVKSSFALLVMTGEDETAEGESRARQNVVHEIGLFQGRLGFSRAIVLVEDGVEVFSNLQGIEQIRYSRNNIKETYGAVLATLRREFGSLPA